MKRSTMEAYAEVDSILELMDEQYVEEVPEPIRELFSTKKADDYDKKILSDVPLQEQDLQEETLQILAVLNYNYWCKDENRKKELAQMYYDNEIKKQKELREKYNPDNLFKNNNENDNETNDEPPEKVEPETAVAVIEEKNIIKRIISFIKGLFTRS